MRKKKRYDLIQRLYEIHRSFINEEYQSPEDLKALLRDWLIHRNIEEDLKMIAYLKGGRRFWNGWRIW